MKFDIRGRVDNMDLPDGKTAVLYSVYEAVSNSIHAITDRFGAEKSSKKGKISVKIELNDEKEVQKIVVSDNGIGFNEDNIDSFETSDSRYKYKRGGKGVGRFVWIKTFSKISVVSNYKDTKDVRKISFDFDPDQENSIVNRKDGTGSEEKLGLV